ncbi:MAG: antitoxin [Bryobacteraceae bacterium]
MRTTVTLDPDVERLIRDSMRELGTSFKEALNSAARAGLLREKHPRRRKFVQRSFRMGDGQGFRWDKAMATADAIEDEELGRKLSLSR